MENRVIKLTTEEINAINELRSKESELITQLGQLEFQIQVLNTEKSKLGASIESLQQGNIELGQKLQTKYGEGAINIETGEFIK